MAFACMAVFVAFASVAVACRVFVAIVSVAVACVAGFVAFVHVTVLVICVAVIGQTEGQSQAHDGFRLHVNCAPVRSLFGERRAGGEHILQSGGAGAGVIVKSEGESHSLLPIHEVLREVEHAGEIRRVDVSAQEHVKGQSEKETKGAMDGEGIGRRGLECVIQNAKSDWSLGTC